MKNLAEISKKNSPISRFKFRKNRMRKIILICAGLIVVASAVIFGLIFFGGKTIFNSNAPFQISTDPISGEEINSGQKVRESSDAPTFYGAKILENYGISAQNSRTICETLANYFAKFNKNRAEKITKISFAKSLQHTISDDFAMNYYQVDLVANLDKSQTFALEITVVGVDEELIIEVGKSGENLEKVYDSGAKN